MMRTNMGVIRWGYLMVFLGPGVYSYLEQPEMKLFIEHQVKAKELKAVEPIGLRARLQPLIGSSHDCKCNIE